MLSWICLALIEELSKESEIMNPKRFLFSLIFVLVLSASGCRSQSANPDEEPYTLAVSPGDFVEGVDNTYLPFIPGSKYVYETKTEDGLERVEIEVLAETKDVMGVTATTVHDTVYLNGEVIEDTFD
jgi:hypothetical protein